MGKLNMVRVDYRMVHGQIVAKWIKFRPVDRLILADDSLVDDPFMGDIYRMAVPDREVDIVKLGDVQTAIDRKNDTVLLIFKDVASAYTVYKNGLQLPELNVGAVQNSAQRKAVVQGVALSVDEYEKLSEMKAEGVNVFLQPIPENDPVSLGSIEKKLK
ncbi:PTS sugar transporter subunit IIB [[Clostridium] innocuum]|uniref:PTS sugar transporter subunit IIB n=1 Tax=Clostridium innocuum TaxID=1522 RepID=UPI001F562492|nr:PTS sugar transporter subunit IIB [[Clostridium] innocuum]MCI2986382.1 PTS sugar transporter subunit IIB [[Clostridium] innocuum]MCR0545891.1 PTS sugar transporter subunit IIB [[Clostridium] innocuum]